MCLNKFFAIIFMVVSAGKIQANELPIIKCLLEIDKAIVIFDQPFDRETFSTKQSISVYKIDRANFSEVNRIKNCTGSIYRGLNCGSKVQDLTYVYRPESECEGWGIDRSCRVEGINSLKGVFYGQKIEIKNCERL
ncbi:MAG: hypothetical protein AB8E15_12265 [Bdellovibrionales bacterium]